MTTRHLRRVGAGRFKLLLLLLLLLLWLISTKVTVTGPWDNPGFAPLVTPTIGAYDMSAPRWHSSQEHARDGGGA